jgi:hypothetical protein
MTIITPNSEPNSAPKVGLTEIGQAKLRQALDAQTDQLDYAVLSALNQRRQIALAMLPHRSKRRWRLFGWSRFALPAALAFSAAALALTLMLRTAQPAISDADAALLADFDSVDVVYADSVLLGDSVLNLNDEELAMMSELDFYAWLDQQKGI